MSKVVVSLTTVPERNGTIEPTIDSLLAQDPQPDEIVLVLPPGTEGDRRVGALRIPEDPGPIAKLYTLGVFPDSIILVTADDDIEYHQGWLATLLRAAAEYPNDAIGLSGYDVNDFFMRRGKFPSPKKPPCTVDVLEGASGVLYRATMFGQAILNAPPAAAMCDDIWISGYLNKHSIMRRVVGKPLCTDRCTTPGLHKNPQFYERNKEMARQCFPQWGT